MANPLRLGVLGLVRETIWETIAQFRRLEGVQLVAAADVDVQALRRFRELTGCPETGLFQQPRRLFEMVELDGLVVGLLPHEMVDLAELCAQRGLPFYVLYPLALRLDDADEIVAAVQRADLLCMVDDPSLWRPALRGLIRRLKEGELGDLYTLHVRRRRGRRLDPDRPTSQHLRWLINLQTNPVGPLMDLGYTGILTAVELLGSPQGVFATAANLYCPKLDVPDYTVAVLKYSRTVVLIESSWPSRPGERFERWESRGTEGTLEWEPLGEESRALDAEEVLFPLQPERSGPEHFCRRLREGQPVHSMFRVEAARTVQEVLEAATRSMDTGMEFPLPLR